MPNKSQQQQSLSPAPVANDVVPVVPASVKSSPHHYFIRHSTHTSVVNDPGPTWSVNKVKTMGPKVKFKD